MSGAGKRKAGMPSSSQRKNNKLAKKFESKPQNRISLLKLPRIVLLEIVENLDFLEVILFSLLSKRAKAIAKLISWSPLTIRLKLECVLNVTLNIPNGPDETWSILYNNRGTSDALQLFKPIGTPGNRCLSIKNNGNAIEDFKQIVENIYEVFQSPFCRIDVCDEQFVELIIKIQPTVRYFWIHNDVTSGETLDRVFKSLKGTNDFLSKSTITGQETTVTEPIPSRVIRLTYSSWFTLPLILNGTNSVIQLYRSNLTPEDINTILKEWQKGSKLQNLEYLSIETSSLRSLNDKNYANEILKDLNVAVSVGNDGRPTMVKTVDDYVIRLPNVEVVRNLIRNDGMIGSIFRTYTSHHFRITERCFHFHVWRK